MASTPREIVTLKSQLIVEVQTEFNICNYLNPKFGTRNPIPHVAPTCSYFIIHWKEVENEDCTSSKTALTAAIKKPLERDMKKEGKK